VEVFFTRSLCWLISYYFNYYLRSARFAKLFPISKEEVGFFIKGFPVEIAGCKPKSSFYYAGPAEGPVLYIFWRVMTLEML